MALMLLHIILSVSVVQKYYSFVAACRCKEHEMKHICRYHGRQAGDSELESSKKEVNRRFWFRLNIIPSLAMGQLLPTPCL